MFSDFSTYFYQNEYICVYIWPAESGSKSFLHSNTTAAFLSNTVWSLSSWKINSSTPIKGNQYSQVQCLNDLTDEKWF